MNVITERDGVRTVQTGQKTKLFSWKLKKLVVWFMVFFEKQTMQATYAKAGKYILLKNGLKKSLSLSTHLLKH
jgi:hypothetical protein